MTRVVFLGRKALFAAHALDGAPFVEARGRDDDEEAIAAELRRHAPEALIVFRPDAIPPGAIDGLAAPVLGVVTDSLAGNTYTQAELGRADASAFDRVVVTDPSSTDAARGLGLPVWRTLPLPVADSLYRRPRPTLRPPRVVYLGHSTMHREEMLIGLKHEFDLPHYAAGLMGDELREVLHKADVGLVVGEQPGVGVLEHTMLLHLAAGHLVLAEPLPPEHRHGLRPGHDYVEVADRDELRLRVAQLHTTADVYDRVRVQGHHASLPFAASKVWPRVIADLLAA